MDFLDLKGRYRRATWRVTSDLLVPNSAGAARFLHEFGLPVLGSAELMKLIEDTCWSAMLPMIDTNDRVVGTRFDMHHCGPTAPGDFVEIEMHCTGVEVRTVSWAGHATNMRTGKVVAEIQRHDASVVNAERFMQRIAAQLN